MGETSSVSPKLRFDHGQLRARAVDLGAPGVALLLLAPLSSRREASASAGGRLGALHLGAGGVDGLLAGTFDHQRQPLLRLPQSRGGALVLRAELVVLRGRDVVVLVEGLGALPVAGRPGLLGAGGIDRRARFLNLLRAGAGEQFAQARLGLLLVGLAGGDARLPTFPAGSRWTSEAASVATGAEARAARWASRWLSNCSRSRRAMSRPLVTGRPP